MTFWLVVLGVLVVVGIGVSYLTAVWGNAPILPEEGKPDDVRRRVQLDLLARTGKR